MFLWDSALEVFILGFCFLFLWWCFSLVLVKYYVCLLNRGWVLIVLNLCHLVFLSPWPFFLGVCCLFMFSSLIVWFKLYFIFPFCLSVFLLLVYVFVWWRDVVFERKGGSYSFLVVDGLKLGMAFFIFREVCFFGAFFWCFFHSSFCPNLVYGAIWPPVGVLSFNPLGVPLLNTLVLLSSGLSVTWSHHYLISNKGCEVSLITTLLLGFYFTFLQGFEYYSSSFTIIDRIYGSVFFIATGFHGFHVLVGRLFLLVCFLRSFFHHYSIITILGFELAIWYWHFVDVVWLFLYSFIYFWGF